MFIFSKCDMKDISIFISYHIFKLQGCSFLPVDSCPHLGAEYIPFSSVQSLSHV